MDNKFHVYNKRYYKYFAFTVKPAGSHNSTETTDKLSGGYDKCADSNSKKLLDAKSVKGKEFTQQHQYKTDMQMQKDDMNSKFDSLKKADPKMSQQNIEKVYASHTNDNTTKQEFTNMARSSQKLLAPKPPHQHQIDESLALRKNESNQLHPQQQQMVQQHEQEKQHQEKKELLYPTKHGHDKNNPPQNTILNQVYQ